MRVFVNDKAVDVPRGARVRDAVAQADDGLARLLDGAAYVTDAAGRPIDAGDAVREAGAVYRVVVSARREAKPRLTKDALEQCVSGGGQDHLPDCHVAGVEVWFDGRPAPGKRISRIRFANGKGLDKDGTYTLVVSDFMATGGSGFRMLVGSPKEDIDAVDIDALTRYLGVLRAPVEEIGRAHV